MTTSKSKEEYAEAISMYLSCKVLYSCFCAFHKCLFSCWYFPSLILEQLQHGIKGINTPFETFLHPSTNAHMDWRHNLFLPLLFHKTIQLEFDNQEKLRWHRQSASHSVCNLKYTQNILSVIIIAGKAAKDTNNIICSKGRSHSEH